MSALFCAGLVVAFGDSVQLKDKNAITGKILAEKSDSVVVDIGYTVLVIPRNQILKTSRTDETLPVTKVAITPKMDANATSATESNNGFYLSEGKSTTARTVRELVNEIGESVVQVRTPSGLGSGFFINAEGFLITNFHVIEGETKISVEVYHQKDGQLEPHSYKEVRIVAINKFQDVALLKIEDKDAPKFKYVPLGNSDRLSVGDHVFAIGSPMGLENPLSSSAECIYPVRVVVPKLLLQVRPNGASQRRALSTCGDCDLQLPAPHHGRVVEVAEGWLIDDIAQNATALGLAKGKLVDRLILIGSNHQRDSIQVR